MAMRHSPHNAPSLSRILIHSPERCVIPSLHRRCVMAEDFPREDVYSLGKLLHECETSDLTQSSISSCFSCVVMFRQFFPSVAFKESARASSHASLRCLGKFSIPSILMLVSKTANPVLFRVFPQASIFLQLLLLCLLMSLLCCFLEIFFRDLCELTSNGLSCIFVGTWCPKYGFSPFFRSESWRLSAKVSTR